MFEFLKRERGTRDTGESRKSESMRSESMNSLPASAQQRSATNRELASVVLRDTLRLNNIPADWIGCESMPRPGNDGSLLIQLVIKRWHDGLAIYAPLLQQHFQQGLQRFDPASDHSGHLIV